MQKSDFNNEHGVAQLYVEVPTFQRTMSQGKEVVFFIIRCCCGSMKWTLEKRYSDFFDTNESLKIMHAHMPTFPPKTYFPLQKDQDIEDRRQQLSTYLKDLANRADMRSS